MGTEIIAGIVGTIIAGLAAYGGVQKLRADKHEADADKERERSQGLNSVVELEQRVNQAVIDALKENIERHKQDDATDGRTHFENDHR